MVLYVQERQFWHDCHDWAIFERATFSRMQLWGWKNVVLWQNADKAAWRFERFLHNFVAYLKRHRFAEQSQLSARAYNTFFLNISVSIWTWTQFGTFTDFKGDVPRIKFKNSSALIRHLVFLTSNVSYHNSPLPSPLLHRHLIECKSKLVRGLLIDMLISGEVHIVQFANWAFQVCTTYNVRTSYPEKWAG